MDTWAQAGNIDGGDTGDIAADSYNNYMEDVQLVINMGVSKSNNTQVIMHRGFLKTLKDAETLSDSSN